MSRTERPTLTMKKPTLSTRSAEAMEFANQAAGGVGKNQPRAGIIKTTRADLQPAGRKSGLVPDGDVRLTANISADLHRKLKIAAAQRDTTIGEMIEDWIRSLT